MTTRRRRMWWDVLDWWDRSPHAQTVLWALMVAALFLLVAVTVGSVTPIARGETITTSNHVVTGSRLRPGPNPPGPVGVAVSGTAAHIPTAPEAAPPVSPPSSQPQHAAVPDTLPPAVRIDNAHQATPTLPPPSGVHGLPFAPAGLEPCAEFRFYADQFQLPDRFDRVVWRESRCRQEVDVRTWCCVGWLQLYVSLHLRDHRLAPRYADCGVTTEADVDGPERLDKQRHVCAAAALFDVVGPSAWEATW